MFFYRNPRHCLLHLCSYMRTNATIKQVRTIVIQIRSSSRHRSLQFLMRSAMCNYTPAGNLNNSCALQENTEGPASHSSPSPSTTVQNILSIIEKECSAADIAVASSGGQTPLMQRLRKCQSLEQVYVHVLHRKNTLQGKELACCFEAITCVLYNQLKKYTWAHEDDQLLWVQSSLNSECEEYFQQVLKCPMFNDLLKTAENHLDTLSVKDSIQMLRSLLLIHFPSTHPLSVHLQQKCLQGLDDFDIEDMARFAEVGNCLKRGGSFIITQLCEPFASWIDHLSVETLPDAMKLFYNTSYFFSNDFIRKMTSRMAYIIEENRDKIDPEVSITLLGIASRYTAHNMEQNILDSLISHACSQIEELNVSNLARLIAYLDFLGHLNEEITEAARKKACQVLQAGFLKATDIVNLANMTEKCNFPLEAVQSLSNLSMLHLEEFDVLLLKHFSLSPLLRNQKELLDRYSERVLEKLDDLMNSPSSLCRILSFYCSNKYMNRKFHSWVGKALLKEIRQGRLALSSEFCFYICNYLCRTAISHVGTSALVNEAIMAMLNQFSVLQVAKLATSLHNSQHENSNQSKQASNSVLLRMHKNVFERLNEVPNLKTMNSLLNTMSPLNRSRPHYLSSASLLDAYERLAETADISSVAQTANIVAKNRLYSEPLLECLSELIHDNMDKVTRNMFIAYLKACATVDFSSHHLPSIVDNFLSDFFSSSSKLDTRTCNSDASYIENSVLIAHNLAILDVFPEKLVRFIFNKDFLLKVDNILFGLETELASNLMSLNRALVLQCPELEVPWIHEELCKTLLVKKVHKKVPQWKQLIGHILEAMLGAPEFVKSQTYSPYFYSIDYECILTSDNIPVSYEDIKKIKHLPISFKRVAVILLSKKDYCTNTHHLIGSIAMKIRHLEILGYTVVKVPEYIVEGGQGNMNLLHIEQFIKKQLFS